MMELLLCTNRDQALLTRVIQVAHEVSKDREGCFVGRTALQKMLYFLKRNGVPMNYRFDLHLYGPFCETILRDAERLVAEEVIKDQSMNSDRYSNYVPSTNAEMLMSRYSHSLKTHDSTISTIVKALAPLRPEQLELLATLDYLVREEKAKGTSPSIIKERVLKRFAEVKQDKFNQKEVKECYEVLKLATT